MRFEYLVVTHRRPVGVMHKAGWEGIDVRDEADEVTVLAQLGAKDWELASVVANPHDTERKFFFKRGI